jgi:hypothetical protein
MFVARCASKRRAALTDARIESSAGKSDARTAVMKDADQGLNCECPVLT